ncbi:unnamed protein product [Trifolium pratense]|uniref:Uncharacterized protein n=1 Tax=Trifolium pratense TaxID=57577 RepID=A0ACB0JLL7_TRIPR|nr:unnamed protein product [Trifolium pratense]
MIVFNNIHAPVSVEESANHGKVGRTNIRGGSRGQGKFRGGNRFIPHKSNNYNPNNRGNNMNGRISKRGGGYKGRNFDPNYRYKVNGEGSNLPGAATIICNFCGKRGHQQGPNCFLYARYQREAQEETRANSNKANIATEYNGSNYLLSNTNLESCSIVAETLLLATSPSNMWKIDSGASQHFSGDQSDFKNSITWTQNQRVSTASGNIVFLTAYGDCNIGGLTLKNVWLVPAFGNIKLISVCQLGIAGYETLFKSSEVKVYKGNLVILTARLIDGLYQLSSTSTTKYKPQQSAYLNETFQNSTLKPTLDSQSDSDINIQPTTNAELWHYRLGHTNYKDINKLSNLVIIKIQKDRDIIKGDTACIPCLAGKMKESFNKKAHNWTHIPARRLHADISGILPQSFRGYRYFLIIVDDATRNS